MMGDGDGLPLLGPNKGEAAGGERRVYEEPGESFCRTGELSEVQGLWRVGIWDEIWWEPGGADIQGCSSARQPQPQAVSATTSRKSGPSDQV